MYWESYKYSDPPNPIPCLGHLDWVLPAECPSIWASIRVFPNMACTHLSGVSLARCMNTVSTASLPPKIVLQCFNLMSYSPEKTQKKRKMVAEQLYRTAFWGCLGHHWAMPTAQKHESHRESASVTHDVTAECHSPTNMREWGAVETLVEADNWCSDPNYGLAGGLRIYCIIFIVK